MTHYPEPVKIPYIEEDHKGGENSYEVAIAMLEFVNDALSANKVKGRFGLIPSMENGLMMTFDERQED